MKPIQKLLNNPGSGTVARRSARSVVMLVAALFGLNTPQTTGQTPVTGGDESGAQVLTRGPVHEAFAGIVSYNPEPGITVKIPPPEAISELPPEMRPEGDNVSWIPGYWAWDDERNDFLWISGTWRALPPGREWISGYWAPNQSEYQWTSGYWADTTAQETTYLPRPPETVESGPNVQAPSADYSWSPGCWIWHNERYAWRPGYWNEGRSDWDWIPAHYVWTRRGYIFVDGYWDYTVARRGVVFAPVFFSSRLYSQRGYRYSPTIAINLGALVEHLFLRPSYGHYYFGDYYAPSYNQSGFQFSLSFQSSRRGYDPFYSHQRWLHRHDSQWEQRVASSYQDRRDHESARPPRTWTAQRGMESGANDSKQKRLMMAAPLDRLERDKGDQVKFIPVAEKEKQNLAKRGQEVQGFRDQRRELEIGSTDQKVGKPVPPTSPTRVTRIESPIVGKPSSKVPKTPKTLLPPSKEIVRPNSDSVPTRQPQSESPRPKGEPRMNDQKNGDPVPQPVPTRQPQSESPRPKGEPRMNDQKKGDPVPQPAPTRQPQSESPRPKGEPRMNDDQKKGDPVPQPAPTRQPQSESPRPKGEPRMIEQKKGNPVTQPAPTRQPQSESPRPKGEPRMIEQKRVPPAPTRQPQPDSPRPKAAPRQIEQNRGNPAPQTAPQNPPNTDRKPKSSNRKSQE